MSNNNNIHYHISPKPQLHTKKVAGIGGCFVWGLLELNNGNLLTWSNDKMVKEWSRSDGTLVKEFPFTSYVLDYYPILQWDESHLLLLRPLALVVWLRDQDRLVELFAKERAHTYSKHLSMCKTTKHNLLVLCGLFDQITIGRVIPTNSKQDCSFEPLYEFRFESVGVDMQAICELSDGSFINVFDTKLKRWCIDVESGEVTVYILDSADCTPDTHTFANAITELKNTLDNSCLPLVATSVYSVQSGSSISICFFSMKKVIHKPQVVTCGLCDRFINYLQLIETSVH